MQKRKRTGLMTGEDFDALPAKEKERIFQELEKETPEQRRATSTLPNPRKQGMLNRLHKKLNRGRPKIGKGVKVVSVSVEVDLLKHADAYAKRLGLKRTELFTQALRGFLPARNAS